MRYVTRSLERVVASAARAFPAVVLTGPRRAGKTSLLRHWSPSASYHLLEDPDVVARLRADPNSFLDEVRLPAILDEVQHVPEVFAHVRSRIDRSPRKVGQWVLTGSQEAGLMRGVTESMAGRAAILQLWPMSSVESPRVSLRLGGYPEVLARPAAADLWFSSYLQTYLERDVRSISAVQDLQGLEVDFLVPGRAGGVVLLAAKATRTVRPEMAAPLVRLAGAMRARASARRRVETMLVHRPGRTGVVTRALVPGVSAVPSDEFVRAMARVQ